MSDSPATGADCQEVARELFAELADNTALLEKISMIQDDVRLPKNGADRLVIESAFRQIDRVIEHSRETIEAHAAVMGIDARDLPWGDNGFQARPFIDDPGPDGGL